jgi:hypothetical protein
MKIIIVICFILAGSINLLYAQGFRGFSAGASGGYTNSQTFDAECFFQTDLKLVKIPIEPKIGLSYHKYATDFGVLDDLKVSNVGLFMEGTVYPFQKYFFTGLRWEIFNLNWFSDQAVKNLEAVYASSPHNFLGTNFYAIAGIDIPIVKAVSFRLYTMPGIHTYSISEWGISSGDGVNIDLSDSGKVYDRFVFQVNAGLVFRIFDKGKK